jgi:hypothetical protein
MEIRYFVKERLNARGDVDYADKSYLDGYSTFAEAQYWIKENQVMWTGSVYQYFIEAERV